jgi:hypothetical protein
MNSIKDIRYYKLFKRTAFQYPDQHKLLHRKVFYFPYNEMLNVFTFLSSFLQIVISCDFNNQNEVKIFLVTVLRRGLHRLSSY